MPLLWQDGAAMLLDLPPGATSASGRDINDHNTVLVNESESAGTATVWYGAEAADLLTPIDLTGFKRS